MKGLLSNKKSGQFLCLLISVCLILPFAACQRQNGEEQSTVFEQTTVREMPDGTLTAPYTSLDSLNPFYCTSVLNASLISLYSRSLFYLDAGFAPVNDLAGKHDFSALTLSVTLQEGLVFSDGSPITSADVKYSFLLAKNAPLYKESLKNIASCETNGTYSAAFTLNSADINTPNVLTFPIVKNGTADAESSLPVSAGFYAFQKDDLRTFLSCNLKYEKELPEIGSVRLTDVRDSSSVMHLLDTGEIDCFFSDLSDGTSKRTYSSVSEIYLNNLVFLGLNQSHYRLGMTDFRRALSLSVDRSTLTENAFLSHARAAYFPFNTSWYAMTESKFASDNSNGPNITAADALLQTMGCGSTGDKVNLTLICTESNSFMRTAATLISDTLRQLNIEITVRLLATDDFFTALENGDYDMYLGEIKLSKNMDLSPFFTENGSASYGVALQNSSIDEAYTAYKSGSSELDEFLTAFNRTTPFIPLVFRNGQFCYSREISGGVEATESRIFGNINAWKK